MPNQSHYFKKKISEINPEADFKVKIAGMIVDKKGDTLVIDDGTSKVNVFTVSDLQGIEVNKLVRVFGNIVPIENGFEVRADFLQDLSGLDIKLYRNVDKLYNDMGVF